MGGAEILLLYATIGSHNQDNFKHFFAGYCHQLTELC